MFQKIKLRASLFIVAAAGLALAHAPDFFLLSKSQHTSCNLIGNVLFFVALFAVNGSAKRSKEERTTATRAATVISCIVTICLLPASAFILSPHWLHGLLSIIAFGSMFLCWSLPSSNWTGVTFLPIFAIVIIQTKWGTLTQLLKIPVWMWLAMGVAWIFITLVVFRWIDKRQANAAAQD